MPGSASPCSEICSNLEPTPPPFPYAHSTSIHPSPSAPQNSLPISGLFNHHPSMTTRQPAAPPNPATHAMPPTTTCICSRRWRSTCPSPLHLHPSPPSPTHGRALLPANAGNSSDHSITPPPVKYEVPPHPHTSCSLSPTIPSLHRSHLHCLLSIPTRLPETPLTEHVAHVVDRDRYPTSNTDGTLHRPPTRRFHVHVGRGAYPGHDHHVHRSTQVATLSHQSHQPTPTPSAANHHLALPGPLMSPFLSKPTYPPSDRMHLATHLHHFIGGSLPLKVGSISSIQPISTITPPITIPSLPFGRPSHDQLSTPFRSGQHTIHPCAADGSPVKSSVESGRSPVNFGRTHPLSLQFLLTLPKTPPPLLKTTGYKKGWELKPSKEEMITTTGGQFSREEGFGFKSTTEREGLKKAST